MIPEPDKNGNFHFVEPDRGMLKSLSTEESESVSEKAELPGSVSETSEPEKDSDD